MDITNLYESQQRGVDHLYETDETQFVAPMGFGKTVVALTALSELLKDKVIDRALVIAPKRVAQLVWPSEAQAWMHLRHLKVLPIAGPSQTRDRLLRGIDADICVIGIDHVPWLCAFLKTLPDEHPIFDCLVIDELSRFKNPRGVWSKAMRKVAHRFKIRWGLTGTPRPNGYEDQFGPLSIVSANKVWGKSFDRWRHAHFFPTDYSGFNWSIRPDLTAQIDEDIKRYTATVDISDMPDVPELVIRDYWVTLPADAKEVYRDMERTLVADLDDGSVSAANMGVATIKLAQVAQGFMYDEDKRATYLHDVKGNKIDELIEALDGDPVLVVYEFQEDLARLLSIYPDLRWLGHGTTDAEARANEQDWNDGVLPIMAIHPASAGHGLNLQRGGRQMIFYGVPWSAELYDQVIKRIHRQGQKERCFVHRILARDTLDQAKIMRLDEKMTAQDAWKAYLRRV